MHLLDERFWRRLLLHVRVVQFSVYHQNFIEYQKTLVGVRRKSAGVKRRVMIRKTLRYPQDHLSTRRG